MGSGLVESETLYPIALAQSPFANSNNWPVVGSLERILEHFRRFVQYPHTSPGLGLGLG